MYKVAFVILHYETLADTLECLDSITANIDYSFREIILVDNASKNKSGLTLSDKYREVPGFHVLLNNQNLGFAKGNNEGFNYAKQVLKADFIIIINNDTLITQKQFVTRIIDRYSQKPFDILGPDIISIKNGEHQNPLKDLMNNVSNINTFLRNYRQNLFLNYLFIDKLFVKIKKYFSPGTNLPGSEIITINPDNLEMEDVKLHGSALVFSPDFVKRYNNAFYPETFLYGEESLLRFFVKKDGLVAVYYPEVQIFHKEDVTRDYLIKSNLLRRRLFLKQAIRSTKVLLKLINTPENEVPDL